MRPSLYHEHDYTRAWPGEQDVHGRAPRPRYSEFDDEEGLVYVVYVEESVVDAITRPNAIYNSDYGRLVNRPHLQVKLAPKSHWIYGAVPYEPSATTLVLWWRRPRQYARIHTTWPFEEDGELTLFTEDQRALALRVRLTAYDQERGHAATGYAVVEVLSRHRDAPGLSEDLTRVYRS